MSWLVFLCTAAVTTAIYISVPAASRLSAATAHLAARIGRMPFLAETIVFCFAFTLAAVPSLIWSVPLPSEPDEFSYLLAADTFAHGRLTNPPHAMANALEYADVIQRPTYASKHPPAQGAVLGLGMALTNVPILGVWIVSSLACASTVWMLRAIAPPRWALLGGLLIAMHPLIASWTQSYWGGSVAMLGGALTLGAVLRMRRRVDRYDAILAGLGLSILALSRPFEGALFALTLAGLSARRWRFRNSILIALPLIPTLAFVAFYNWRVTGDWKLFPHRLHQQQYMITPRFFWEAPRPELAFNSPIMRDFARIEFAEYQMQQGWSNHLWMIARKTATLTNAYFTPAMLLLILALPFRRWPARLALALIIILPTIHLAVIPITRAPYFAPIVGAIVIATTLALRSLRSQLIVAIALATQLAAWIDATPRLAAIAHSGPAIRQVQEIDRLSNLPGKHLVFVRYDTAVAPLYDFVHNGADIDGGKVVFARSISPQRDRATRDYFHNRICWLLVQDERSLALERLP